MPASSARGHASYTSQAEAGTFSAGQKGRLAGTAARGPCHRQACPSLDHASGRLPAASNAIDLMSQPASRRQHAWLKSVGRGVPPSSATGMLCTHHRLNLVHSAGHFSAGQKGRLAGTAARGPCQHGHPASRPKCPGIAPPKRQACWPQAGVASSKQPAASSQPPAACLECRQGVPASSARGHASYTSQAEAGTFSAGQKGRLAGTAARGPCQHGHPTSAAQKAGLLATGRRRLKPAASVA